MGGTTPEVINMHSWPKDSLPMNNELNILVQKPSALQSGDCYQHYSPTIGSPGLVKILTLQECHPQNSFVTTGNLSRSQATVPFLFTSVCQHEDWEISCIRFSCFCRFITAEVFRCLAIKSALSRRLKYLDYLVLEAQRNTVLWISFLLHFVFF